MLKKSLAALAVVGGLTVPAVAHAVPTASTASNVQLAWVDGKVRITWTEPAGIPNGIAMEATGQQIKPLGTTTASGPNELVVPASALDPTNDPAAQARIIVTDPSTAEVRSVAFDRYIRGATDWAPGMSSAGVLYWALAPDRAVDTTPDDPLDTDQPARYIPRVLKDQTPTVLDQCQQVDLPATTTPYGTIPNQGRPYVVKMDIATEWGRSQLTQQRVRSSAITFNAPASTVLGAPLVLSGGISLRTVTQSPAGCVEAPDHALAGQTVVLHARNSSTSPWYTVNVTKTDAAGKYSFALTNRGGREYRAVVFPQSEAGLAVYQSISASKVVRAITKVVDAKFITPVIRLGQQPNAYLRVEPAGSQRAALQFKNASGQWQGLLYKTLYAGRGLSGPFALNRLGQTQFRWWVPASTSNGLPVGAVYSSQFTLTVVR